MKKLLALTILALGIPTLMGSQVQDTKDIKPLNTMTPTDEDGDLCAKGITEYKGAIVVCNETNFKAMRSNNKYVLGTSFSIFNKSNGGTIDHRYSDFELDGRGNLITLKENVIAGIVEIPIMNVGLFKTLSHNTVIKNFRVAQQIPFAYSSSSESYNMYGGIAARINADRGTVLIENVNIEQNLVLTHDNEVLAGAIAGDIIISNGATMEVKGVNVTTNIDRDQINTSVTDRIGGLAGDLLISTLGTSIKVSNTTINANHRTRNITSSNSHVGGFFGRVVDTTVTPASITDKGVVIEESQVNYIAKAGRGDGNANANRINNMGGAVGYYQANGSNINTNFKNLRMNLDINTDRNRNSVYYHNVGGIIGDLTMGTSNSSIVNIDSVNIKGGVRSNALNYERVGGIVGVLVGNDRPGSLVNVRNVIMEAPVQADNTGADRKNGRTIGEVTGTQAYALESVFYMPSSIVNEAIKTDLNEVDVTKDEMDYYFFSGEARNKANKSMSLDIDKWEVMPYTEFFDNNGTLKLELKWQVANSNPVVNDTTKAPTIDIESFRFPDGDKVSPIIWVVGALVALLTGAFIWYKKRKSAY